MTDAETCTDALLAKAREMAGRHSECLPQRVSFLLQAAFPASRESTH